MRGWRWRISYSDLMVTSRYAVMTKPLWIQLIWRKMDNFLNCKYNSNHFLRILYYINTYLSNIYIIFLNFSVKSTWQNGHQTTEQSKKHKNAVEKNGLFQIPLRRERASQNLRSCATWVNFL
mgnify:FL=1